MAQGVRYHVEPGDANTLAGWPQFDENAIRADPSVADSYRRRIAELSAAGLVIANNMLYWRVIEGGLGAIAHRSGSSCPSPRVWTTTGGTPQDSYVDPGAPIQF